MLKHEHVELKTQHVSTVEEKTQKERELAAKLATEVAERENERTDLEQKILGLTQAKEELEALNRENQSEIDLLASQLNQKSAALIDLEERTSQEIQSKSEEIETLRGKLQELELEKEVSGTLSWVTFHFLHRHIFRAKYTLFLFLILSRL